ncbi:MAG: hypothetical protein ACKO8G_05090 [Actinomycetota bacterium]
MLVGLSLGGATACSTVSGDEPIGTPVPLTALGTLRAADDEATTAQEVTVGLYGVNSYDLDVAANTFYFSGYMWLRWSGDATIDPTGTVEIANVVEEWGLMLTPLTKDPDALANGDLIQQYKVSGRFFQPFDLRNYPLDRQELPLVIESSTYTEDALVFVPDTEASGLDSRFQVPGWNVTGFRAERLTHDYGSGFGSDVVGASNYSALKLSVSIERVRNLFLWKLLLPVLLVLGTNWLSLVLTPKLIEVRTAMPATALLTTVFLQQSSLDALPQVSSLVLMDLIYLVAYVIIVLTFAQVIWDNNRIKHSDDEDAMAIALRRTDRMSLLAQVVLGVGILATLVLSRL